MQTARTRAIVRTMDTCGRSTEAEGRTSPLLRTLDEAARLWAESGGGVLPVSGRSMRPTFEDASRVWIQEAARVRFGDILVYTNGSFLVVHRVVAVHRRRTARRGEDSGPGGAHPAGQDVNVEARIPPAETHYRTKGDGLPHLDPALVPASHVLGCVVGIEREGRRYRTDASGGRLYAALAGGVSAAEGLLYRFAYRMDRVIGSVMSGGRMGGVGTKAGTAVAGGRSGPVLFRRAVRGAGRFVLHVLDRALFARLNAASRS